MKIYEIKAELRARGAEEVDMSRLHKACVKAGITFERGHTGALKRGWHMTSVPLEVSEKVIQAYEQASPVSG